MRACPFSSSVMRAAVSRQSSGFFSVAPVFRGPLAAGEPAGKSPEASAEDAMLALYGVTANMMRDDGWRMIRIGGWLERAHQITRLLGVVSARKGMDPPAIAMIPAAPIRIRLNTRAG